MDFRKRSEELLRNSAMFLLVMAFSALAWAGNRRSAPAPSRPAAVTPHLATNPPHLATNPPHPATNAPHPTNPPYLATNPSHLATNPQQLATNPLLAPSTTQGRTVALKNGGTASYLPNGQVRSIDKNGLHIEQPMRGPRTVVSERNGARVVNIGAHGGYVQRDYVTRNGQAYVQRTYVGLHGAYTHVYRTYYYGGRPYYGYYPAYYYHPAFYGWAYNPWPAPVAYYGWGWARAPWYGYYSGYFAPYPVYTSAAFWLTDYVIAANLQAAYEAQAEANAQQVQANSYAASGENNAVPKGSNSNSVVLTPDIKQAIAEEVKAQLLAEQAISPQGAYSPGGQGPTPGGSDVPPALDPAHRTFVVASSLDVTSDGQECALTAGDVITRLTDTPQDNKVTASVSASKKTDCAAGKQVAVSVDDLQEMHNHFQEQLNAGMMMLADKQNTGGLPAAPDTNTRPGEVPLPAADTTAAKALEDQQMLADLTDAEVKKEALLSSAAGGS